MSQPLAVVRQLKAFPVGRLISHYLVLVPITDQMLD